MRTANSSTSDNTTYTFEMPAANVTVSAEFEKVILDLDYTKYTSTEEATTLAAIGDIAVADNDTWKLDSIVTANVYPKWEINNTNGLKFTAGQAGQNNANQGRGFKLRKSLGETINKGKVTVETNISFMTDAGKNTKYFGFEDASGKEVAVIGVDRGNVTTYINGVSTAYGGERTYLDDLTSKITITVDFDLGIVTYSLYDVTHTTTIMNGSFSFDAASSNIASLVTGFNGIANNNQATNISITDLKVIQETPKQTATTYTVKYIDAVNGDALLGTSAVQNGNVGGWVYIDKADKTFNETNYRYTSDDSATKLLTVNAEDNVITVKYNPYVTVPVKHVYEDASGSITVGEKTYTAFSTDGSATGVSGDTYTIEDSYKTAIDDTTTTKAYYVFDSQLTDKLAANTPLYVLYTKNDYKTTTFSLTIPAGLTYEDALAIPVKVTGTPNAAGATALNDEVVTVTVAKDATTGSAMIDLLDSTDGYSYVIDDVVQKYVGASGTVAAGGTVTKELEANSKTPATITVKYVNADDATDVIKTEEITQGVYVSEEFTVASSYADNFTQKVGDNAIPYKKYTYHADGSDSLTITPSGNTESDTITLKYDTTGIQYYYEEDFEGYDSVADIMADSLTAGKWYSKDYSTGVTFNTENENTFLRMEAAATNNTRGVRYTFDETSQISGKYVVEFDAQLPRANGANANNKRYASVTIGDSSAGSSPNAPFEANYIFQSYFIYNNANINYITAGDPETFTATPAWFHYVVTVDTTGETKTASIVVTNKSTGASLYTGTATINGTGVLGCIQIIGGAKWSSGPVYTTIDNIQVYKNPTE